MTTMHHDYYTDSRFPGIALRRKDDDVIIEVDGKEAGKLSALSADDSDIATIFFEAMMYALSINGTREIRVEVPKKKG